MSTATQRHAASDPAAFVERFQTFWSSPRTVPLDTILTSDVQLCQPLSGAIIGLAAANAWRGRLLATMPNLQGEVQSWSAHHDLLFIELQLSAREQRHRIEWRLVDRIRLRGGFAAQRVSYFDSLGMLVQIARQPRTWPRFLRWARSERQR